MTTLSSKPFWLDGGYDFESVKACVYHPNHSWITIRLGDVLEPHAYRDPDELMIICKGCYVPRCGHSGDIDPCLMWRHHETNHRYASGRIEPVGGWPSK
jgi:hypothetical protein